MLIEERENLGATPYTIASFSNFYQCQQTRRAGQKLVLVLPKQYNTISLVLLWSHQIGTTLVMPTTLHIVNN